MKTTFTVKFLFLASFFLILTQLPVHGQAVLGPNPHTQVRMYEYYRHGSSEWVKLFRVLDQDWSRGGVSGVVHFVDYLGEGAGMVEFTIPQRITPTQKPTLVLHGNAADNFSWHVYQNTVDGGNGYDVYLQMPGWHAGLTFLLRGYDFVPYFAAVSPPGAAPAWSSSTPADQGTVTFFKGDGSIGFGTSNPNPDYKLSVNGKIRAKEIKVDTGWSDFVFEKGYKLLTLEEVEDFIEKNGHLPDVPSAKVVEAEGVNVGEMESMLLRKIEELTLYIMEQNKQLQRLGKEVEALKDNK